MQIVYYFDKPTIGYCPDCDCLAVYRSGVGMLCPNNKEHTLSYFEWNENSRHPEEDEEEEY